jgi:ABC-type multidrug transport system fused ATPase/permease subunit
MHGRTSIIIAHRLSTIRDSDTILVLRDGKIAEAGTHDVLVNTGAIYADLYRRQFSATAAEASA